MTGLGLGRSGRRANRADSSAVEGYRAESYGERLADVYDDWYQGVSDVESTVAFLDEVATATTTGRSARFLELAVGTGRLAVPLAERGHEVTGVDVSDAMLDHLRAADPRGRVTIVVGDMVDDLPPGPFDVAFVAYNSLFMLTRPDRQAACFAAVADRLDEGGVFVVEAFVPHDPPREGSSIEIRSMTADRVVLSLTTTDPVTQQVAGQFVDLVHGESVRLRPFLLRYSTPNELDGFATAAGLRLRERWQDVGRTPFTEDSVAHLSMYERPIRSAQR